jgi:hypothetical protein
MTDGADIRQVRTAARILLICPDCGHENAEYAQTLQGRGICYCVGEGYDYIFDLVPSRRHDLGPSFTEWCNRLYAALFSARRPLS